MHRVDVIEIDGLLIDCGTLVDAWRVAGVRASHLPRCCQVSGAPNGLRGKDFVSL
jgi:hypothetical protein